MTRKAVKTFYLIYQCATPFYEELINIFADKKSALKYAEIQQQKKDNLYIKVVQFNRLKLGHLTREIY